MAVTAERLRELLDYDPVTGEFRWRVKRKKVNPGDLAVSTSAKRYRHIHIDNAYYLAHRLAWLWVNSEWPKEQIDHINHDAFDNRIANLREASSAQNAHNRRGDRGSKSGLKGVYPRCGGRRFEAWIMAAGEHLYLGRFATAMEASAAYQAAAKRLHGIFAMEV